MTRRGSAQRPWTTAEIDRLRDMAGRIPVREICRQLKRSRKSVEHAAARLGLSLRCCRTRLVWCDECASWRSRLNDDGKCRVCQMRDQLAGREAACVDEYVSMTPEQRAVYDEEESSRGTRPSSLGPRPTMRESCPLSRYQRDKARSDYFLAIEAWEHRRVLLPYNAAKTRLKRMREIRGTNPRKKS